MNIAHQNPKADQLFDMLARQWTLSSAVEAAVFSTNSSTVAFACSDGSVSVVATKDADSPTSRLRRAADTGDQTMRPRKGKIGPVQKVACPASRSSSLVAFGKSNFIFGTSNGQLAFVTPQGSATLLDAGLNLSVGAVAAEPGGKGLCYASGREIFICEDKKLKSPFLIQMPSPVVSIAYSPDGLALAVAHETGLTLLNLAVASRSSKEYPLDFPPLDISWSANGQWIASSLGLHGAVLVNVQNHQIRQFADFPISVNSLSFSAVANAIAISGAYRATAWSLAELRNSEGTRKSALISGRPGLVPVESLSANPTRNILAVGYSSGLLNLTQFGGEEEMLLDRDSGVSISSLSWAGNGNFLAIGRADGIAALAEFPPGMFK